MIGSGKQCDYITKEDVSSPTVSAEAVMLTCVIDAREERDVALVDIPNAFVQTVVSKEDTEHQIIKYLHSRTIGGHIGVNCTRCMACIFQQTRAVKKY